MRSLRFGPLFLAALLPLALVTLTGCPAKTESDTSANPMAQPSGTAPVTPEVQAQIKSQQQSDAAMRAAHMPQTKQ